MTKISNNPDEAIKQILKIAEEEKIPVRHSSKKNNEDYYLLGDGLLVLENYDEGRSKRGLFTTCNPKLHRDTEIFNRLDIINKKLGWEKWGKSSNRKCFNTLGKDENEIRRCFKILNLIYDLINI